MNVFLVSETSRVTVTQTISYTLRKKKRGYSLHLSHPLLPSPVSTICSLLSASPPLPSHYHLNQECSNSFSLLCMISCFRYVQLFVTLCTVARQAPLSTGFSRQESWSRLLCPPPGESSKARFKLASPELQAHFLP